MPTTVRSTEVLRHGAYVCLRMPPDGRPALARRPVPALVERLGLRNEFEPGDNHPTEAVAFLRRVGATPADIADDALLQTDAVVHVASPTATVADFCSELGRALAPAVKPLVLGGVVRPMLYTGNTMTSRTRIACCSRRAGSCRTRSSCP
jgi:hypothetical protein